MKKIFLLLIVIFWFNVFAADSTADNKVQKQINDLSTQQEIFNDQQINHQKLVDEKINSLKKYENLLIQKIQYQQE